MNWHNRPFLINPSPSSGGISLPLKANASGRFFVDQNNTPFLLIGDSPQPAITTLSISEANRYFADRQGYGFNTMWMDLLVGAYTNGNFNGLTYDGIAPFTSGTDPTNYDLSTPNATYFTRADAIIAAATSRGMIVLLDPCETGSWEAAAQGNSSTICFNYGVFLGNRYKNNSSVIWTSGNDFQDWRTNSTANTHVAQIANGINSVSPNTLQTIELDYNKSYSTQNSTFTQSDCNWVYTYFETYDEMLTAYNASTIPAFLGEGNYEGDNNGNMLLAPATPWIIRMTNYWSMTSGACGLVYANHESWHLANGFSSGSIDTVGSAEVTIIKNFFASFPWYNLVPDQTNQVVTAGFGTYNGANGVLTNATYCTTAWVTNGSLVLAYCPVSTTLTVNMAKMRGSTTARWFDPTLGTYSTISGSPFANSGSRNFATPGSNHADGNSDWVLVLQA